MTDARATHARKLAPYAALFAVVAAAYSGLARVGLVWDDPYVTVDNPFLATWSGVVKIATSDVWSGTSVEEVSKFYRPLPMLAYALDRAVLGNTPLAYHASSLLAHLACVWLLYAVARESDRSRWGAPSLAAAALFGVAPLGVEAVTWIGCRFDLLGLGLTLGGLVLARRPGVGAAIASGVLVGAAVFCKETFIVGPVLVVAYELWVRRRRPAVAHVASVVAVIAVYVVLRRAAGVSSVATVSHLTVAEVVRSYAFLLETFGKNLIMPTYLDPSRPYAPRAFATSLAVVALAGTTFAALAFFAWRRADDARVRLAVLGVGWFLLSLGPPSAAGPTLGMVGDRYAYFPMFGVFVALAAALSAARAWWPIAVAGVGVVASVARVRSRVPEFHDDAALFGAAARDNDQNAFAWYTLGQIDAVAGRFADAETKLWRADALQPGSWRTDNARCYVRLNQGRLADALALCKQSAQINGNNPRVWSNLAAVYTQKRSFAACVGAADQGIQVKPHNVEARYLRAVCLANLGKLSEASAELRRCLDLAPGHRGANDLAAQFREQGIDL